MGYKLLITIDISASSEQRTTFYEHLSEAHWTKIQKLTTTWKVEFQDPVLRASAIEVVIADLKEAKRKSGATSVEYAMQLAKEDITVGKLPS